MTTTSPPAHKSLWHLSGVAPAQFARNIFAGIKSNNVFGRASQLAFAFVFALFPLILLMLTWFGMFDSRGAAELQRHLVYYFSDLLPPAAFRILRETSAELAENASSGNLTFGIVFSLLFASGAVSSMITSLNAAYRVRDSRSWLRIQTIALALTALVSILLPAASILALLSSHALDWLGMELHLQPMFVLTWKIMKWPVAILFVLMCYSAIYSFGPHLGTRRWHWITPGSLFGTSLWLLASIGFRVYLHFLNTYAAFYGSLGGIMTLLVWLYVVGLAFLIGGEINAEIERAAMPSLAPASTSH
ncbi:MAG: YihY/virulence factor BrkB family protein [Candidatus Acidiferrales bacterium]